jgi:pimeloyl-ACP methyl ester carboxylesterase
MLLQAPHKVRKYQTEKKRHLKQTGQIVNAITGDDQPIEGTWLNRNSNKLIVIGNGFTNAREHMAPFGDLFHEYDLLFFDMRGHGFKTGRGLINYFTGVEAGTVSFGQKEHLDVKAIVDEVKRLKEYDEVVGVGLCYSALIFNKSASIYPDLFDRIILDGCWQSLYYTTQELAKDLGKLAAPQRHSSLKKNRIMQNRYVQKGLLKFAEMILKTEFNTVSVLDYTSNLPDIPVLFIYGKDDALIPREQFERVWHATNAPRKTAVITSAPHVRNHLHLKEVYKEICTLFIENTHEDFTRLLTSPDAYMAYKSGQLQQAAGDRLSMFGEHFAG